MEYNDGGLEQENRIFRCGIYWVFAENLTACINNSPDIGNPIGIIIITQEKFKSNLGDQKIGNFRFWQAESGPEHLGKQMAACRDRIPI